MSRNSSMRLIMSASALVVFFFAVSYPCLAQEISPDIYSQLEFSPDPSVAAVSTLMIGLTAVLILMIDRFFGLSRIV